MVGARETLKRLGEALGVYSWIREKKDLAYRTLRDWDYCIKFGLRHLFQDDPGPVELAGILAELNRERILELLDERIAEVRALDDSFAPGVSSWVNLMALYVLCRTYKPKIVIETGVASGASSFVMLSAL